MSDGQVVIDLIVDGNDVKTVNKDLDGLEGKATKATSSFKGMLSAMGVMKVAGAAVNVLKGSLDGAISRFDTFQKFPKVMAALGFSADDSKKSMDKLSEGIDGLPTTLDDVVASTQQMAATTGDLDRSTDTVIALNNAFLASGASSEDATRGMQQYNQMLSNGTVDLDSWKTIQETMPLALQKTAEAMGFTGATAKRDLYQALQDGEVTFDQFSDSLIELGTGTGDLAKLAKENSLGIATSITNLKNSTVKGLEKIIEKFDELSQKLTGKSIAEHIDSVKGIINKAFDSMANSVDKLIPLFDFFTENKETIIAAISGIGGAFLIFKTVESVPKIIDGVKKSLGALSGVFGSLTSPIGLISFAIGALIGVFVYLWQTNEEFRDKVIEIWDQISDFLQPKVEAIANFISEKWAALKEWWSENQQGFLDKISEIWGTIVGVVQPIIETVVSFITEKWTALSEWWNENQQSIFNTVSTVWNAILEYIQPIIQAISDFIMEVWGIVSEWWNENQETILNTVTTVWSTIQETFTTVLNAIQEVVSFVLDNITKT